MITYDFETYYDQDFSLSKLTTEEYIRDPRFEVIGVAVKQDDAPTEWFSGTREQTGEWLRKFDWSHIAIAHNAAFDAAILSWVFDIHPKRLADTLSMARAKHTIEVGGSLSALAEYYKLGAKGTEVIHALGKRRGDFNREELARYGQYCINDVELTAKLFHELASDFPLLEFKLIDITLRMFTEPKLEVDTSLLETYLQTIQENKQKLLDSFGGDKGDLMSNDKFAQLLMAKGVTPPTKVSLRTGKEAYAFAKTDEEFTALLEHPDEEVQALVSARLGLKSTIEETRTERLIAIGQRGHLPIPLKYYAARTGRWGGDGKINPQNFPRKSTLKAAMRAPEGYRMVDSDSSQIEARTLAWLACQDDLVEVFEMNNAEIEMGVPKKEHKYDPYKVMASRIYGKASNDITDDERFVGKSTLLGCGYGMGSTRFYNELKKFGASVSQEDCENIIQIYRQTYRCIPNLWKEAQRALSAIADDKSLSFGRNGVIEVWGRKGFKLPNGLFIEYPNLRQTDSNEWVYDIRRGKNLEPTKIYSGKVVENLCQALARIIIGEQMVNIAKQYPVVLTVHDAIACLVPEKEVDNAVKIITNRMRERPSWAKELPLNCEVRVGQSYGSPK